MARKKSRAGYAQQREVAEKYGMELPEYQEGETHAHYYKRLASTANERLRQLERLSESGGAYKGVLKYAYANAMYDIQNTTGTDSKVRFPTGIPKNKDGSINENEYRNRFNAVSRFLESPTSTKQGLEKVYQKRADTVNQKLEKAGYKFDKKFTWEDLANYYESDLAKIMASMYGSESVLVALAYMHNAGNDAKRLNDIKAGRLKLSDDEVENKVIQTLANEGIQPQANKPSKHKRKSKTKVKYSKRRGKKKKNKKKKNKKRK